MVRFRLRNRDRMRYHLSDMEELEALRRRRRSVRPQELHRFLLRAGFQFREGRGSHRVYSHPSLTRILTIPQSRTPVRAVYVDAAIQAIREVRA